jgi:hypothetical protein
MRTLTALGFRVFFFYLGAPSESDVDLEFFIF